MMNTLAKSTVLVLLLFLGGCAHHSGYYTGRSDIGTIGISVDSYIPFPYYHDYHEYDVYLRSSVGHKYRAYKPHYDDYYHNDRHHKYTRKHDRSFNKHYSKRDYGKHNRGYAYKRKGKGGREYASHASKHNYYRHR